MLTDCTLTCLFSQNLVSSLISIGSGREAAFAAAILGDNTLMEKTWHDTGMLAEAVLHAHVSSQSLTLFIHNP